MNSIRISLKKLSLVAAAGAVAVMGTVTVAMSSSGSTGGTRTVFVADTTTQTTPPATPGVASAAPVVKATTFAGGDWPGMGTFGEDWG